MNLLKGLLVSLFIGMALTACGGPAVPEVDTEATIASGVAATQTATAPTDTPIPVPTDTPTPLPTDTPVPVPTDTPLPPPTDTPPPASLEEPTTEATGDTPQEEGDVAGPVLEVADLPAGFEELNPGDMGMSKETMSNEQFEVNSLFAFMQPEQFEIVMGFTTLLDNKLEQAGFDAGLRDPELLSQSFIGGMDATNILEQQELVLEDLGDEAAGLSIVADMGGVPMQVDVAVFRKDQFGAFVMMMYLEDQEVSIQVEELARKLANKIG